MEDESKWVESPTKTLMNWHKRSKGKGIKVWLIIVGFWEGKKEDCGVVVAPWSEGLSLNIERNRRRKGRLVGVRERVRVVEEVVGEREIEWGY